MTPPRGLAGHPLARTAAAVVATLAALVAPLAGADQARAGEAPRWVLTAVPTPTSVMPETPRDEVQTVTVTATGGTFQLEALVPEQRSYHTTAAIPYNASAAEVQAALEAIELSVSVTGGPGAAAPYQVTFTGESDGDVAVRPMRAVGTGLQGGTATVAETAKGAAPPQLILTATNVGGAATNGERITVSDVLPPWLTATAVSGYDMYASGLAEAGEGGAAMTCTAAPVSCEYEHPVDPGDQLIVTVTLAAAASSPPGAVNDAAVAGGGAAEATSERPLAPGAAPAGYGPAPGSVFAAASTMQAGAHPDVTTMFEMATSETDENPGDPKDIRFDLPPGLVGSTVGMPRCSMNRVINAATGGGATCPDDTMVGAATVSLTGRQAHPKRLTLVVPVYNIAPAPGEPAAFGFDAVILPVRLDTSVLSNGDYGVRVTAPDLPESSGILASNVTVWGVPAEHSGPGANGEFTVVAPNTFGGVNPGQSPVPLLTGPQQCSEPLLATMSSDSWEQPGAFASQSASMGTAGGCGSCRSAPLSASCPTRWKPVRRPATRST